VVNSRIRKKKDMKIYMLESEDVTNVGGPMHLASSSTNWVKPFESLEAAKAFAEKDYNGEREIKWKKTGKRWCSGDLSYVMYTITKEEVGTAKN
jgi:hypothetical protein